mgnify:CR=1 FL=1
MLKVNADGERFFNESGTYEGILHADEYQKGHCHYSLFDSTWTDFVQHTRMAGCSRLHPHPNGARPIFAWEFIESTVLPKLIADGFVQKADTIEELARKLRLPPEASRRRLHATTISHTRRRRRFRQRILPSVPA